MKCRKMANGGSVTKKPAPKQNTDAVKVRYSASDNGAPVKKLKMPK